MHNKFIIGDADYPESAFVLTGSTNLTTGQLVSDLNDVIVFEDQSLARAYEIEFEEMWGGDGAEPEPSNSKFGPERPGTRLSTFSSEGRRLNCISPPLTEPLRRFRKKSMGPMPTLNLRC